VEFKHLGDVNSRQFKEAIGIYVESIPRSGRHPVPVIEERVVSGKEKMFVNFSARNHVTFVALIWPLKGTDFVLLDYMATKPGYRNKGIGSEFLRNIFGISMLKNRHVIVEVDDPRYGKSRAIKARRVEFYRRNGAKEMKNVTYLLPPLSGKNPTRMIIMTLSPESLRIDSFSAVLVKQLLAQIYRELYNRKKNDLLLNSFVNDIPSPVELV